MEKPLLNDPAILPSDEVLSEILGEAFPAFAELTDWLPETGLQASWNYYKDGGAWLCKVGTGKKTVFWLSAWKGFFRTTFYLVERNLADVAELPIAPSLKEQLSGAKAIGKLVPLTLVLASSKDLKDLYVLARFKKNLK